SDQAQLRFKLNKAAGSSESYQLTVNEKGVLIEAPSSAGLFYGLQTLWQLLPPAIEAKSKVEGVNWSLPYCSIKDAPRVGWRGLMLDVARHFFTKE
ncbi:glycoside hydrolase family 20 zincin-like fold domain-containing protein, partial [Mariniradius sediminis]